MSKPLIAIVGRPNVGKSTLFNKLCGKRMAIVDDTPGVTRDRLYAECEWRGKEVRRVDTGGIEPRADDVILKQMRFQAQLAIDLSLIHILRHCSRLHGHDAPADEGGAEAHPPAGAHSGPEDKKDQSSCYGW